MDRSPLRGAEGQSGKIPIVNRAIKFQPVPTAPPVLGQHTDEILRDILGLTSEQIEELRASKAVA